jgi:hypothetical protein
VGPSDRQLCARSLATGSYRASQYESAAERRLQMPVEIFCDVFRPNLSEGPVDAQD